VGGVGRALRGHEDAAADDAGEAPRAGGSCSSRSRPRTSGSCPLEGGAARHLRNSARPALPAEAALGCRGSVAPGAGGRGVGQGGSGRPGGRRRKRGRRREGQRGASTAPSPRPSRRRGRASRPSPPGPREVHPEGERAEAELLVVLELLLRDLQAVDVGPVALPRSTTHQAVPRFSRRACRRETDPSVTTISRSSVPRPCSVLSESIAGPDGHESQVLRTLVCLRPGRAEVGVDSRDAGSGVNAGPDRIGKGVASLTASKSTPRMDV
jgi:hypothetical protein